ncbi:Crp/Fnr family transcriptional regulator [Aquibacillus sp. LR5S19]|uniref:Crp/Fnr family transcriptional regulator n=1 Tax=Aquibacillus rhizosphaerae TaxID=3051431 RepID=A0ABT7L3Z4_9BACI|nr:Crp/Fnr family transcriptional regulator [Aquibacillus sp. LR5S19]MDL4840584.1 Crp/Fnr family transcriptional regulator [Aquibacillus sp. LR5S19]
MENKESQQACNHTIGSHKSCISLVPIFNHLESEQMDEILMTAQSVSYKKGEIIYQADNQSTSLYIVNSGKVRIFRLSESGKEQLVRILNPGDFTGEYALFSESTHESFAEAMVDTAVCMINRTDLQAFLLKYPSISLKILAEFSTRLEQSEKQSTWFATEKVETRIAHYLIEGLAGGNHSEVLELPMSKKDLASYLGTTPETISRKLADLEAQGLIKLKPHKKIEIIDVEGLLLV